jgi:hypothetical protein
MVAGEFGFVRDLGTISPRDDASFSGNRQFPGTGTCQWPKEGKDKICSEN